MILPLKIPAGTSLSATASLPGFPAGDWVLKVFLRGPSSFDIVGTARGADHVLAASASQTAAWLPGRYTVVARAFSSNRDWVDTSAWNDAAPFDDNAVWVDASAPPEAEVVQIEVGFTEVTPDILSTAPSDCRSHARRVLESIEAVLEKRAGRDTLKYEINGRSLERTPMRDLLTLRAQYKAEVAREDARARGRSIFGQSLRVVF